MIFTNVKTATAVRWEPLAVPETQWYTNYTLTQHSMGIFSLAAVPQGSPGGNYQLKADGLWGC